MTLDIYSFSPVLFPDCKEVIYTSHKIVERILYIYVISTGSRCGLGKW